MRKQTCLLIFLLGAIAFPGFAQQAKLKKAQFYMETLNYEAAIDLYKQVLEKRDLPEAKMAIAEAYRKLNDCANAEIWYAQIVQLPDASPFQKYYYGLMLQRNGKCEEASYWYEQFLKQRPYDVRKKQLVKACAYRQELLTQKDTIFELSRPGFNGTASDIGPAFYRDGLVFGSTRIPEGGSATDRAFFDLYFVPVSIQSDSTVYGQPTLFSPQLKSRFHDAIATFSNDQKEVFFTRNRKVEAVEGKLSVNRLEIMFATLTDSTTWGNLTPLPFNNTAYSVAHPSLSPDGNRLFFSSDMPGGFGGKDIYVCSREGGLWGIPVNLGPNINTDSDELYPFFHQDKRLYFSSDGHFGLGGQDVFVTRELEGGDWEAVENLGAPVNTEFDDFGFIVSENGLDGYFASDRTGNDDIYHFSQQKATMPVPVADAATPVVPEPVKSIVLNGRVVNHLDGTPLAGASVQLTPEACGNAVAGITNNAGEYSIALTPGCCYKVRAEKGDFFAYTLDEKICADNLKTPPMEIQLLPFRTETTAEKIVPAIDKSREQTALFKTGNSKNTDNNGSIAYLLNIYYDFQR
ncbi:MAG: PD40 domain-containing protein [Saprospiraceae bacterium]|nr:PD40 domain-containing protein [Saprospiraceae bacterium]